MKLTLKNKFTEAGNAVSFIFTPGKELAWEAGQYMNYKPAGSKQLEHWFTIASAPYEKDPMVTTRLTGSEFKNALNALEIGDTIEVDEPEGDFTWVDTDKRKFMVAAGIGITPFHSILKERFHHSQSMAVALLYANRDDEIPYRAELDKWQAEHPEFKVAYLTDKLSADLIAEHVPSLSEVFLYLSGPEAMVQSIGKELIEKGLPKDQLKTDEFLGYTHKNY